MSNAQNQNIWERIHVRTVKVEFNFVEALSTNFFQLTKIMYYVTDRYSEE